MKHSVITRRVWVDTAILPEGWLERLIPICNENTRHVKALCLEPHDLAVAKLVAGREKDRDFLREMLRHGMIHDGTIMERMESLPVSSGEKTAVRERWERIQRSV